MSRPFDARFHGACPACDCDIDPGQLVRYGDDDRVVHDVGDDAPAAVERPDPGPCASCRLVYRGECL